MVEEYLETLLPDQWDVMSTEDRIDFLDDDYEIIGERIEGTERCMEVTNMEIWCECFRKPPNTIQSRDSYQIAAILKRLGWERTNMRRYVGTYGRQRIYQRGDKRDKRKNDVKK